MNVDRMYGRLLILAGLLLIIVSPTFAWQQDGRKQDPGYLLYREGYRLILDERWGEARAKFDDMLRRYPSSSYVDDARFWSAYSWKSTSSQKALDGYRRFIKEFPRSNYFDDAVAEYQRLGGRPMHEVASEDRKIPQAALRMAELEQELARIQKQFQMRFSLTPPPAADPARHAISIKIEALQALGRSPGNPEAFVAVREAALNSTQPFEVRVTALQVLESRGDDELPQILVRIASDPSGPEMETIALRGLSRNPGTDRGKLASLFHTVARDPNRAPIVREAALFGLQQVQGTEAVPFLVETVRQEGEIRMREVAVISLGALARNQQGPTITALRDLVEDRSLPSRLRQAALAQAVDADRRPDVRFLERIAEGDPDEEVQLMALHVVSRATVGNPGSFEILSRLYRTLPQERLRGRETLLYAIASIGSEASVEFLADAARHAAPPLRQRAVFYLGTIGSDAARRALLEIVKSPE